MSIEEYRNRADEAAFRAQNAAQMAARAAERAYMLGPGSIAAELSSCEARVTACYASTSRNAALRTHQTSDLDVVMRWCNVAQYVAEKAVEAANQARSAADDATMYD